jgi:hypothetical protein
MGSAFKTASLCHVISRPAHTVPLAGHTRPGDRVTFGGTVVAIYQESRVPLGRAAILKEDSQ